MCDTLFPKYTFWWSTGVDLVNYAFVLLARIYVVGEVDFVVLVDWNDYGMGVGIGG